MNEELETFVQGVAVKYDETALYRARVNSQNADGTLDVTPEDPRYPTFPAVPIRFPGTMKIAPGSVVLIGFENGDIHKPMATCWDAGGGLLELVFGEGEGRPVARVGDAVALAIPSFLASVTIGANPPVPMLVTIVTPISGSIATGSSVVKVTR